MLSLKNTSFCTVILAVFASFTYSQPYYTNSDKISIQNVKQTDMPWPLFDPQEHQESLKVVKRGGIRNRRVEYPEIPTYIEGKASYYVKVFHVLIRNGLTSDAPGAQAVFGV